MLFFFRPRPKFQVSDLLLRQDEPEPGSRYLIVHRVRWITLNGESRAQWVYDGLLADAHEGEIVTSAHIFCVGEEDLAKVTWHKHNRELLDPRLLQAV